MSAHCTRLTTAILFACITLISCSKSGKTTSEQYTIPDTYSFAGMDSLGAKTILSMLGEMELAINKGNSPGTAVHAADLRNMYRNVNSPFTDTVFDGHSIPLNSTGVSLSKYTVDGAAPFVEAIFDSIELASTSMEPAQEGVGGVSSRQTLLSANGVFLRQLFTKTMMGVVLGHLITDVYLGDSLTNGPTTAARLHAWDQAFFLWSVPSNFPANRKNVKYWGSYTSQIDSGIIKPVTALTGINANQTLLNAFIRGRAALANNDEAIAVQQAAVITAFFETMEAAAALHETNEAKGNLANSSAAVVGNLSESFGFWMALHFNRHKKISDSDWQSVADMYGADLWKVADQQHIQAIQDRISYVYGWDALKSNL